MDKVCKYPFPAVIIKIKTYLQYLKPCTVCFLITGFFLTSFSAWSQPLRFESLNSTVSDKSRSEYTIQNPREAWTQMQIHQFLSENPKAVYLLDAYEKHRNKIELERAYSQIQRADFFETYAPKVRLSGEIYAGADKKIKYRGLELGVKGKASMGASKTWSSERLLKRFFAKDYVQVEDGSLVNKIGLYSINLTHDIYECEKNKISCRLNSDPAFQYLYEVILKKEFSDFPKVEEVSQGQREYLSFEEMKLKEPQSAGFIEDLFTGQKTLKTTKEVKSVVLKQLRKLIQFQYGLDTLIKTGYGASQLETDSRLSVLKKMLDDINALSKGLRADNVVHQVKSVEQLSSYLSSVIQQLASNTDTEEDIPLLPIVSAEYYGFGQPGRRTQALEIIKNRDYFQPRQCLYREKELLP